MTDKPRKTLSIKRKPETQASLPTTTTSAPSAIKRNPKRIIKRDDLPAAKLAKPKAPPKPKRKPPAKPKAATTPPSDIRAHELRDSLNGYAVWRTRQPLAIGIEREIFQHIAKHQLSASKRVVMKLLRWHTRHPDYLRGVLAGGIRLHLDGTEAAAILPVEQEHAARVLAVAAERD